MSDTVMGKLYDFADAVDNLTEVKKLQSKIDPLEGKTTD
jgi:hypothetical protein